MHMLPTQVGLKNSIGITFIFNYTPSLAEFKTGGNL